MSQDFYLRFADEAESIAILYTQVPTEWNEEGEPTAWYEQPNYANIDTIGIIYEPQEVIDPENPPEPIPYDGYFINIRVVEGENAEPLMPYSIDPKPYPMRVWG